VLSGPFSNRPLWKNDPYARAMTNSVGNSIICRDGLCLDRPRSCLGFWRLRNPSGGTYSPGLANASAAPHIPCKPAGHPLPPLPPHPHSPVWQVTCSPREFCVTPGAFCFFRADAVISTDQHWKRGAERDNERHDGKGSSEVGKTRVCD